MSGLMGFLYRSTSIFYRFLASFTLCFIIFFSILYPIFYLFVTSFRLTQNEFGHTVLGSPLDLDPRSNFEIDLTRSTSIMAPPVGTAVWLWMVVTSVD